MRLTLVLGKQTAWSAWHLRWQQRPPPAHAQSPEVVRLRLATNDTDPRRWHAIELSAWHFRWQVARRPPRWFVYRAYGRAPAASKDAARLAFTAVAADVQPSDFASARLCWEARFTSARTTWQCHTLCTTGLAMTLPLTGLQSCHCDCSHKARTTAVHSSKVRQGAGTDGGCAGVTPTYLTPARTHGHLAGVPIACRQPHARPARDSRRARVHAWQGRTAAWRRWQLVLPGPWTPAHQLLKQAQRATTAHPSILLFRWSHRRTQRHHERHPLTHFCHLDHRWVHRLARHHQKCHRPKYHRLKCRILCRHSTRAAAHRAWRLQAARWRQRACPDAQAACHPAQCTVVAQNKKWLTHERCLVNEHDHTECSSYNQDRRLCAMMHFITLAMSHDEEQATLSCCRLHGPSCSNGSLFRHCTKHTGWPTRTCTLERIHDSMQRCDGKCCARRSRKRSQLLQWKKPSSMSLRPLSALQRRHGAHSKMASPAPRDTRPVPDKQCEHQVRTQ